MHFLCSNSSSRLDYSNVYQPKRQCIYHDFRNKCYKGEILACMYCIQVLKWEMAANKCYSSFLIRGKPSANSQDPFSSFGNKFFHFGHGPCFFYLFLIKIFLTTQFVFHFDFGPAWPRLAQPGSVQFWSLLRICLSLF